MIVEQSKEILLNGSTELPDLKYSTPEIPNCLTLKYLAEVTTSRVKLKQNRFSEYYYCFLSVETQKMSCKKECRLR